MAGKKSGEKPPEIHLTSQRVDFDTLYRIKTIDHRLVHAKKMRVKQWEIIRYAIMYVMEKEKDYLDYVEAMKIEESESTLDTLARATSKPWFPYGNLIKVD